MINSVDTKNPGSEFNISKIHVDLMSLTPQELEMTKTTLNNFSERYKYNWRNFSVSKKNGIENAVDDFKEKIGVLSPAEIDVSGADSSFLVAWNIDGSLPGQPIDIWFGRSLGVVGPTNDKDLKVHYLKIATMDHVSGNISSDTVAGRRIGDHSIALNAKVVIPISK